METEGEGAGIWKEGGEIRWEAGVTVGLWVLECRGGVSGCTGESKISLDGDVLCLSFGLHFFMSRDGVNNARNKRARVLLRARASLFVSLSAISSWN